MDTRTKIIESQKRIIDNLAECETLIGQLYGAYAGRFPAMKEFWTKLSKTEASHARLLRTMHRILDKGSLFYNLGKFDDKEIQHVKAITSEGLQHAIDRAFTPKKALSTALAIESSLLDAHFYDVVKSEASEFKIIAQRLSSDTRKHLESIRHAFNMEKGS